MYAGQSWDWSEILNKTAEPSVQEQRPLYVCAFSSDKGTEALTEVFGKEFFSMYGATADFAKHGQPLVQAHKIINAGGRVLAKRLVSPEATLANLIINATVKSTTVDKVNEDGEKLYIDEDGKETTVDTGTPVTITTTDIKYSATTVADAKMLSSVVTQAETSLDDTTGVYPIMVICDNGRGNSGKKFRIKPNYDISKNLNFCLYSITEIENTTDVETVRFSMDSDIVYLGQNMAIQPNSMKQLDVQTIDDTLDKFYSKIAELSGMTVKELKAVDILFGKNLKGAALPGITVDITSLALDHMYGLSLLSGTDGDFTEAIITKPSYTAAAVDFFSGVFDDAIFDLELYKLDYIFDANYPDDVKRSIETLVNFRQDCFFFRDLGLEVFSYAEVVEKVTADDWAKSKFIGDYATTYEIIEPYSKKQVRVTMMYSLASMLVDHTVNGRHRPLAGETNNMIVKEAIKGTLNFAPRITPAVNQKQQMDDLRVNFANYSGDKLIIESLYTSQDHLGPLSYINNVIGSQEVVKAVRTYCPKIRFRFQDGSDFTEYKDLIESTVLRNFTTKYKRLELVYTEDPIMAAQKVFEAFVYFEYNNFVQHEAFHLYAIESTT